MEAAAVSNGVVRYAVVSTARTGRQARVDTPLLAQEFVGDPKVTVDVHPSGRVDFFVTQPVRIRPRNIVVDDNHRVKVPRHGHISVKHFPSTTTAANGIGPKVPPLWPSSRDISEDVLAVLDDAAGSLIVNAEPGKAHVVRDALSKLGIEVPTVGIQPATETPVLSGRN